MALRRHPRLKTIPAHTYLKLCSVNAAFLFLSIIFNAWFAVGVSILYFLYITALRAYSIHPDYKSMIEWDG